VVVPSEDVAAMAQALRQLAQQPQEAALRGAAGRSAVEQRFSLQAMVGAYQALYDRQLQRAGQQPLRG
jgi:glycosyltransferase involved in cell wall biosynthesis